MNHLESLIAEYLDWQGYLVRRNTKVGRLPRGGWAMELDVVGYNPHTKHLVHYEPSVDGHAWAIREERFTLKFGQARMHILSELFSWLPKDTSIDQIAICVTHPQGRDTVGGGRLQSLDEFVAEVRSAVIKSGTANRNAISETYPLLRTLQLTHCGYNGVVSSK
jgi:hypothetical protein